MYMEYGRVMRVLTGARAFKQDYVWEQGRGGGMTLQPVDADPNRKPGYSWRGARAEIAGGGGGGGERRCRFGSTS